MDAYLDRELSEPVKQEVDAHLARCRQCRCEHGGLLALLQTPAPIQVPSGLRDRIAAALESEVSPVLTMAKSRSQRPAWWFSGLRYAVAMAACMALFVSGWMVSNWWSVSHSGPGANMVTPDQTVVVSPWMMNSWAQAAAMPGPISPAVILVQGVIPEMMIAPAQVEEPTIRVYRRPSAAPATQPADSLSPELRILPLGPRYLGA
jgi:hypothetical protein